MKVLIASAICLIVLIGQTSAFRYDEVESDTSNLKESLKLNIHQTETIREVDPSRAAKGQAKKEQVFVSHAKPVYVTGKSRRVVIPSGEPIVVKPAPVLIRQKPDVEVRPIHITRQPAPVIVTKRIVKLHQPIVKKYYVEKYRKEEKGCAPHVISHQVSKKTCDCKPQDHVVQSNINWSGEDNASLSHLSQAERADIESRISQQIKALQGQNGGLSGEFDAESADFQ